MTKYVEALESCGKHLTEGKIYEVIVKTEDAFLIEDDVKDKIYWSKHFFKEVEAPTTKETNTFKFIPETEITYAIVNGVKGILIKE